MGVDRGWSVFIFPRVGNDSRRKGKTVSRRRAIINAFRSLPRSLIHHTRDGELLFSPVVPTVNYRVERRLITSPESSIFHRACRGIFYNCCRIKRTHLLRFAGRKRGRENDSNAGRNGKGNEEIFIAVMRDDIDTKVYLFYVPSRIQIEIHLLTCLRSVLSISFPLSSQTEPFFPMKRDWNFEGRYEGTIISKDNINSYLSEQSSSTTFRGNIFRNISITIPEVLGRPFASTREWNVNLFAKVCWYTGTAIFRVVANYLSIYRIIQL